MQFLNGGPRSWNVATNGGFTITIILRVGQGYIGETQVIFDSTIDNGSYYTDKILLTKPQQLLKAVRFSRGNEFEASGTIESEKVVVSGVWISIVITYSYDKHETSMSLNGALSTTVEFNKSPEKETDPTLDVFYVGSYYSNPTMQSYYDSRQVTNPRLVKYFNGDISGLFTVDELLTTDTINTVQNQILWGFDFGNTVCGTLCMSCPVG